MLYLPYGALSSLNGLQYRGSLTSQGSLGVCCTRLQSMNLQHTASSVQKGKRKVYAVRRRKGSLSTQQAGVVSSVLAWTKHILKEPPSCTLHLPAAHSYISWIAACKGGLGATLLIMADQ